MWRLQALIVSVGISWAAAHAQEQRAEWKVDFHALSTNNYCLGYERGIIRENGKTLSLLAASGKWTFFTVDKTVDGSIVGVEVAVNDVSAIKRRWRVTAAPGSGPREVLLTDMNWACRYILKS